MNVGMAFERPHDKVQKETRAGLCHAISQRNGALEYDWIVRLTEFREKGWYWYPKATDSDWHRDYDLLRADHAYLMAAMTDAERDSIVEGL